MSQVPNIKFKTEYCLYWQEEEYCQKGSACFFAHGPHELRTIQQNHLSIRQQQPQNQQPSNYKTVFCKFYAQGECRLGNNCTYAHERRKKRQGKPEKTLEHSQSPASLNAWETAYYQQLYYQLYINQLQSCMSMQFLTSQQKVQDLLESSEQKENVTLNSPHIKESSLLPTKEEEEAAADCY